MSRGEPRNIAVDLDGTLAEYHGYDGPVPGPPIPMMVRRVKAWLAEGKRVWIFTARATHPKFTKQDKEAIQDWCMEHVGQRLPVTGKKLYFWHQIWDDRSVSVLTNTGMAVDANAEGMFLDDEAVANTAEEIREAGKQMAAAIDRLAGP